MPREFSETFTAALMAQQSGLVALWLLTLEHDRLGAPIRLVNNTEDVQSRGNTYTALGFEFIPADDREGPTRRARLELDNAGLALVPAIRTLQGSIGVTAELAILTDADTTPPSFDTVEIAFLPMRLRDVSWDETRMWGTLADEDYIQPFPAYTFDPFNFRGLY